MEEKSQIELLVRAYETTAARDERKYKRLWIVLIITILLLAATNVAWLIYIAQYDFESYDYAQDGTGVNIIGDRNGVSYNGTEVENKEKDVEESFTS